MNKFYNQYYEKYWNHRVKEKKLYKDLPTRTKVVHKHLSKAPGLKVLDIGTGDGSLGKVLKPYSDIDLDGVDVSKTAAQIASQYYKNIYVGDITDQEFSKSFENDVYDAVVSLEVIEHLIDPYELLTVVKRVLKAGGVFFVSTPNIAWWKYRLDLLKGIFIDEDPCYGDLDHLHFFTLDSLVKAIEQTGLVVEEKDGVFVLPWYLGRLPHNIQRFFGKRWPNLFSYQTVLKVRKPLPEKKMFHFVPDYLHPSESWIHNQVKSQKQFPPVVISKNKMNETEFGWPNHYQYPLLYEDFVESDPMPNIFRSILVLLQKYRDTFTKHEINYYLDRAKKLGPKLIHAHYGPSGYKMIALKKQLQIPLVVSFYGSDIYKLPKDKPEWRAKYQELFKQADALIVKGPQMSKKLQEFGCQKEKIYYIDHGIDLSKIPYKAPKKTRKVKLLVASRLEPVKGIEYILKAFKQIAKEFSKTSLTIIGSGSQEKELKKLSKELKLKNVTFLPFMPHEQLLKEVSNYHIFLHPSISANHSIEGNPTSLIERIAAGLPAIATAHGDIPEVVKDGRNGYLVEERNTQQLVEKINFLIENQQLWSKFSEHGRKIVENNFDLTKQTSKREKLYAKLIDDYENTST